MGKQILIINNVNEKSGAPIALYEFLKEFDCYVISIREDKKYKAYKSDFNGIKSSKNISYIFAYYIFNVLKFLMKYST